VAVAASDHGIHQIGAAGDSGVMGRVGMRGQRREHQRDGDGETVHHNLIQTIFKCK
jgi:hypothetical protein